jgi:hypothetical protein
MVSRVSAIAVVFACASCVAPLPNQSTVQDVRILAISADPPEITYPVHGAIPTTSSPTCQIDPMQLANASSLVTLRALIGDPNGGGRLLHYTFLGCAQTGDERCPDAGPYVIAEGDSPAPEITVSWNLAAALQQELFAQAACRSSSPGCAQTPILTAFADNPLGFCRYGLWFQLALSVTAPDGEFDYGAKLFVFNPVPDDYPSDPSVCPQGPDGGPPPHHNPILESLWLDGQALPLQSSVTVQGSVAHDVIPIPPSNGFQEYCVPTFSKGWERLTENWLYEMETTAGSFDRQQAGELTPLIGLPPDGGAILYTFVWTPSDNGVFPDAGTLYEVTRDGRGGTSWIRTNVGLSP